MKHPAITPRALAWSMVALLSLLVLLSLFVYDRYRQAQADAATNTHKLVQLVEANLSGDFARIDSVLIYIARRVSASDLNPLLPVAANTRGGLRLTDLQASFPMIAELSVFDAQGVLRYASDPSVKGINIADRPHFQRLRDNPTVALSFSQAQIARTTGQWSIVMVRALRDAQGRFLGTANAVIGLEGIGQVMGAVDVGAEGGVLLRSSETFKLMQRRPRHNEKDFNQPLPKDNATRQRIEAGERAGVLSFTASTDGVERLGNFKRMEAYPFYVQVALSRTEYLAVWRQEAAAVAGLACLLLLGYAYIVARWKRGAAAVAETTQQLAYRQALFAGLFEQSGFLAGILDSSGRLLEVNQTALAVIGAPRELVLGQYFPNTAWWSRPQDRTAMQTTIEAAAMGKAGSFEAVHQRVNHEEISVLVHAKPVFSGQERYIAVTGIDITERKLAELALQQQSQALLRSNAELEQFAYVASHDLRQPLRMVTSYVQLLERVLVDKLDHETREMMHFAVDGARRMDQMLVSLLEYSRVGRKGEPMQALASRTVVDEALHFLAPAIQEARATMRVTGVWPQIVASPDEFSRLWQNLIANAVKFRVPDRLPEIDISVTTEAHGGGWRFCVADNGIGINPTQFDRLFKVFQRLHARDQYDGNGIGLAVARKIVERHGGRIWVESDGEGLGTRFCFVLPLLQEENTP